jgi:hypothetical protein
MKATLALLGVIAFLFIAAQGVRWLNLRKESKGSPRVMDPEELPEGDYETSERHSIPMESCRTAAYGMLMFPDGAIRPVVLRRWPWMSFSIFVQNGRRFMTSTATYEASRKAPATPWGK